MSDYLKENLLPLILSIKPKKVKSDMVKNFLGLERVSTQSILISLGNHLETFWNKVESDSPNCVNLIETCNMVNVAGKLRQVDHNFYSLDEGIRRYLESKCNLNLDSEKIVASNAKLRQVKKALNADHAAYFCPVVSEISHKDLIKYNNHGIEVYGVKWMLSVVNASFTEDEYFTFAREVLAPILVEMGL
jgi:hypothetical protein